MQHFKEAVRNRDYGKVLYYVELKNPSITYFAALLDACTISAHNRDEKICKLLIDSFDSCKEALKYIWHKLDIGTIEFVLKNGMNVNTRFESRGTTLVLVIRKYNPNENYHVASEHDLLIIKLLLDYGADIKIDCSEALHLAILHNDEKLVSLLLKYYDYDVPEHIINESQKYENIHKLLIGHSPMKMTKYAGKI